MPEISKQPTPLLFKPDLEEANNRWQAFYAGEIIDRPVVRVTAPLPGVAAVHGASYRERVFGDLEKIIARALRGAEATYFGGEAIPCCWFSFGPDEIAVFCGAELAWSDDSGDTNWSVPCVEDWNSILPLRLQADNPLWQRMLSYYRLAAERLYGKMALSPLDLHSNMDLLAALRGPQRLCEDLLDQPEMIDAAMDSARAIFPELWRQISLAGRMNELGYDSGVYAMDGAAVLQCDFSCLISPEMFDRWVRPALEEEISIVGHNLYHWDGPDALRHTAALLAMPGLHGVSYVPGANRPGHIAHLELFKQVQAGGKAVHFGGTPDECKAAHRELRPEKTVYCTWTHSPEEADELLEWFVRNT